VETGLPDRLRQQFERQRWRLFALARLDLRPECALRAREIDGNVVLLVVHNSEILNRDISNIHK
jgi:hypothetical protein